MASLAIETQQGEAPLPRFGHSTTFIGNGQVILFGGAVGDTGRYQITNDTYQLDLPSMKWTKLAANNAPLARAAHGATCVDPMQLVIYGGAAGGGSLSSEELYLLLLDARKSPSPTWMTVPISGTTPGRRYGHTLVYYKPNLIVFGGNDGAQSLNDIWFMDVEHSPFHWVLVNIPHNAKKPPERTYHSAEICREGPASGMMVIFGGRTTSGVPLRDVWGLRQHRNGQWDWVPAPVKRGDLPDARFQHTASFVGTRMFICGGREEDVGRQLPTAVYDTEGCEWKFLAGMGRFRHASWTNGSALYTFGGFDHQTQSHPTGDLQCLDISSLLEGWGANRATRRGGSASQTALTPTQPPDSHVRGSQSVGSRRTGGTATAPASVGRTASTPMRDNSVRIADRVHTKVDSPHNPDFSTLVRKISIDRLADESKKIRCHQTPIQTNHGLPAVDERPDDFADKLLCRLLRPNITLQRIDREFSHQGLFTLTWDEVKLLTNRCTELFRQEEMVLKLRAPIKVYGDIHGQYYDLMRLFGTYKCPVEEDWQDENDLPPDVERIQGDIDCNDYLFLGDFVDRGHHSLEVICLLLALKLKYPRQVHLIRGNHEDPVINCTYGFKEECRLRLSEDVDDPQSCWRGFNALFEYLPLGAVIEDKILCIHGGIGGSVMTIHDIEEIPRPLKVSQSPSTPMEQRVTDLLWSDPTENDSVFGIIPNDIRDPDRAGHIVKFGPDRVLDFNAKNNLCLIIRAHECVHDGFERFAGGRLITLFSATDYCNHKNAGALLFIRRDLTVVPKIIYPPDRNEAKNQWLSLSDRPATPPRSVRKIRDPSEPSFI